MSKNLMTSGDVEAEYGIKTQRLAQWRHEGDGPVFLKEGNWVRYRRDDIEAWLDSIRHTRTDRKVAS